MLGFLSPRDPAMISEPAEWIVGPEEPEPAKEFIEEELNVPGDLDGTGFLEVPLNLVIDAVKL